MTASQYVESAARILLAVLMVTAGVLHFAAESIFVQIVPPQLPAPGALVLISGVFEIALGLLLLVPRSRRLAGLGLVALYLAVFPANIYMAIADVHLQNMPSWFHQPSALALWLRLPLQLGLIAWALWVSRSSQPTTRAAEHA
jgi:uncharacterized membrane protein